MRTRPRLAIVCAVLAGWGAPLLAAPAQAQAAFRLDGTCERLVVADRDLSAACAGALTNAVSRGRTSFDFTAGGETVSFMGNGAQQDATEESDPLQPINAVSVSRTEAPVLAIGACRFSTPEPNRTAITCEASAPDGRAFAGTFVTAARPAQVPGSGPPSAR